MHPLSYHTEVTVYFLFFFEIGCLSLWALWISLCPPRALDFGCLTKVSQLLVMLAGVWVLVTHASLQGTGVCTPRGAGESSKECKTIVAESVSLNLWTVCYQSPKSSRHSMDTVLSVVTHRLPPGEIHPCSNHSSSLMRKPCSCLHPLFLRVRLNARKLLEPLCKHSCGTHFPSLLSFSLLFRRAFEWKHFYKVKCIQIYAPFQ